MRKLAGVTKPATIVVCSTVPTLRAACMCLSIGVPSALMRGDVIVIVYALPPCSLAKVRASSLVCFGAIDLTFIACEK
jgi:hypothetical protein